MAAEIELFQKKSWQINVHEIIRISWGKKVQTFELLHNNNILHAMNKLPGEVYKKSAGWAPPHFRITKKKLFYRWASYGSQSYFYIWFWQKSYQENLYNTIAWILQHPKKQYIDWHTKNFWAKKIFFSMKELV